MTQSRTLLSSRELLALKALLEAPDRRAFGRQLMQATRSTSGALYPALHRMVERGLLTEEAEKGDPLELGRPLRRYYTLTTEGEEVARDQLSLFQLQGSSH